MSGFSLKPGLTVMNLLIFNFDNQNKIGDIDCIKSKYLGKNLELQCHICNKKAVLIP